MNLRRLGVTGLPVSVLGFGCGAIGGLLTKGNPQEQRDAIATALGAGINYFDTAPLYGNGASESNLGRVFSEMGGVPHGVVIGTKVRIDPTQAKDAPATIRSSIEDSLNRLRMDRVDLLQLHTSITEHSGRGVTVSDVLGPIMDGLEAVRDAGLASWVGITANGDTEAVREVVRSGRTATAQIMLNALNPSAGWAHHLAPGGHDFSGLIRDTITHDVGVIVIRSLAAGALAAKDARHPNAGEPGGIAGERYDDDIERARRLSAVALELGMEGPAELAVRFAQSTPGVATVIVGYSDHDQLDDAIRWTTKGNLAPEEIARILHATVNA